MYSYLFTINGIRFNPFYSDKLELSHIKESGKQFFRAELSEELTFSNQEFDFIIGSDFETEFHIQIFELSDLGGPFPKPLFDGNFYISDCKINRDDRTLAVKPKTKDQYTKILAGLEKEFNLIKLLPEIQELGITKRPVLQLYVPGSSVITNFVAGNYWEHEVTPESSVLQIQNEYHFSLTDILKSIIISGGSGLINGRYVGPLQYETTSTGATFSGILRNENTSDFVLFYSSESVSLSFVALAVHSIEVRRVSDSAVLYKGTTAGAISADDFSLPLVSQGVAGFTGTMFSDVSTTRIYARYLLDVPFYMTGPTIPIPENDISGENINYKRLAPFPAKNIAFISERSSAAPTEYGTLPGGLTYYEPPNDTEYFVPINRNKWGDVSTWLRMDLLVNTTEINGRITRYVKDNYPLHSVIQVLLRELDPTINFLPDPLYSQALYSSILGVTMPDFLITPNSNILTGDYSEPAKKAPITLKNVLDVLESCFRFHWFIEDGKLRIEHINYFRNGGSYAIAPFVQLDISKIHSYPSSNAYYPESNENVRSWAVATDNWEYEKIEMPERYTFSGPGKYSLVFGGFPIEMLSNFVQKGDTVDISTGQFSTDIDSILVSPDIVGKDGFMLLATPKVSGFRAVEFRNVSFEGRNYSIQNGFFAWPNLHNYFWKSDFPAKKVKINDSEIVISEVARNKVNEIEIPGGYAINLNQLIETPVGLGQIEKISLLLGSKSYKVNLKYDTY